ncbi:unnamed protein product [Rotaria socialis]
MSILEFHTTNVILTHSSHLLHQYNRSSSLFRGNTPCCIVLFNVDEEDYEQTQLHTCFLHDSGDKTNILICDTVKTFRFYTGQYFKNIPPKDKTWKSAQFDAYFYFRSLF